MKNFKKIIAVILSLIITATAALPAVAISTEQAEISGISDYKQMLWEEGFPVFSTEKFMKIANIFNSIIRLFTWQWIFPENHFNVTIDDFVTNACDYVFENCCLDIVTLLTNIPDINGFAEITTKVFNIDTVEFRNQMYAKRDEYWDQGNTFLSSACDLLGAYMSVIELCEVYAEPTANNPVVYEVRIRLTYRDGGSDIINPGIFINTETGECTNRNNSGLVKTGFNFSLADMMVYATIDCWMRDFGFCVFYDIAANSMPLLWNYETRRFKFDYNGLEWMIQIWKGNYLITNGGEVGLYNRKPGSFGTFYNTATDDQLLEMSMQVYHGDDLIVEQKPQKHWWVNGFNMSDRMYLPESLTLKFSIVMPDEEMLNAFCEAIDNHYKHDVTYSVDGLTINVAW